MTDADLAKALGLSEAEAAIVIPKLGKKRAVYERLIQVGDELNLWTAGLGPKPKGVIICKEHKR